MRNRTEPWLLLVTSRVGHSKVAVADMEKLVECVHSNATSNRDFANRLTRLVPASACLTRRRSLNIKKIAQTDFVRLFSVGLGKWLLRLMASGNPKWGVTLQASYSYRVHGKEPDMVSYAFSLQPFILGPTDRTGLSSKAVTQQKQFDERRYALGILDGVQGIKDLDAHLRSQPRLKAQMEDASAELLATARYKPDEYRKWLKQFTYS